MKHVRHFIDGRWVDSHDGATFESITPIELRHRHGDLRAPFGGMKDSGIGREGGPHSEEFFTEAKAVVIQFLPDMAWVRVCRVDELTETAACLVTHEGRAICVALADGQPRAVDDQCPHRGVALSGGLVRDGVITCPGHFRRFDLRTARCVGRPWEAVRSYECAVVDGWVQIDLGTAQPAMSVRELLLAHARGDDRPPEDD